MHYLSFSAQKKITKIGKNEHFFYRGYFFLFFHFLSLSLLYTNNGIRYDVGTVPIPL